MKKRRMCIVFFGRRVEFKKNLHATVCCCCVGWRWRGGGGGRYKSCLFCLENATNTIRSILNIENIEHDDDVFFFREHLARKCSLDGTQDPLLFVHPNADGTGSKTEVWESEAATMKTELPGIDGGTAASVSMLTYEQQKRFVLDGIAKCWQHAGVPVTYTITEEAVGPTATAKAVLTFPTYRQLLDVMYADVEQAQQQHRCNWVGQLLRTTKTVFLITAKFISRFFM
jgi:hypothetical protein